jgi:trimeric autotransporter adhesin
LEPTLGAPNVILGRSNNGVTAGVVAASIGGGEGNSVAGDHSTISGGTGNSVGSNAAFVGGGSLNHANGSSSTLAGGYDNAVFGGVASIGGGARNRANNNFSTIAGGENNTTSGDYTTVAGGYNNRASGLRATIAGGANNVASGEVAMIGGGNFNAASGVAATVAGGDLNSATNTYTTVGGGSGNKAHGHASTIAGGFGNTAVSSRATIGGGQGNSIEGFGVAGLNTVAGGYVNTIGQHDFGTIGGGTGNRLDRAGINLFGVGATIPGGVDNEASGSYSFAAGRRAKAQTNGKFVWADSQDADYTGSSGFTPNSVNFRCSGGAYFTSGSGGANQTVYWTPGSGSWSFASDRELKDRIEQIDPQAVLTKVSRLPIAEWSYTGYPQRHIGAMAQDFHALFALNSDDKMLNDADLHGVALAAIQGLNQKLEQTLKDKDARIAKLESEVASLKTAQGQASAEWDARFQLLQKAVARISDKTDTTLAIKQDLSEAP